MRVTGVVLLRTLRELFEISANRKRIADSVEALERWLEEAEMLVAAELREWPCAEVEIDWLNDAV